ncbi:MAG TPA: alpha-L-fucosidase, partial [Clostridiales bacterium]|nr:alpha-L-fucosidase [Clostridiales bacterium]
MIQRDHILWYKQPAKQWMEALPIGNGRLGGMVFGQVENERIQLNEDSLWYGGPSDLHHPDTKKHIPEIRQLLFEGKTKEAEFLASMAMTSAPKYLKPYHPLCDLLIGFWDHPAAQAEEYRRELDMEKGVVRVSYKINGIRFTREIFASHTNQVMVLRFGCDQPEKLSMKATLYRRPFDPGSRPDGTGTLIMNGRSGEDGVHYSCLLKAISEGGTIKNIGDFLFIQRANAVTLILAAATSFRHESPEEICRQRVQHAVDAGFRSLKSRHEDDHQEIFNRVQL